MAASLPSSSLPTPQQLLTSLLDTIAAIPAPDAEPHRQKQASINSPASSKPVGGILKRPGPPPPSNLLKLLDPSHRKYFLTLHVLFPSLLLPALDLLDRGLVSRLALPPHKDHEDGDAGNLGGMTTDEDTRLPPAAIAPAANKSFQRTSQVYHVRSAVQRKIFKRGGGGGGGGGGGRLEEASLVEEGGSVQNHSSSSSSISKFYIIHTTAWNCTCAAFAFAAFPPLPSEDVAASLLDLNVSAAATADDDGENDGMTDEQPRFGGLSFSNDGVEGTGMPPCCKHLLACVLAERWGAVLGRYVTERSVTREEMAGIFADI